MQTNIDIQKPCTIIGPFLAYPRPGVVEILIALPRKREIKELSCELILENGRKTLSSSSTDSVYNVFRYTFTGLPFGELCSYRFLETSGRQLDLEGLTMEDCVTRVPGRDPAKLISLSCHHPFYGKDGNTEGAWQGWVKAYSTLQREPIGLLAMLGDQVYNDDLFFKAEKIFREQQANAKEQVTELLIENYLLFWGDFRYRRVLARVPSVVTWDDHDIVDGFGSRPEQWEQENETIWNQYFEAAREIYVAYQICRNPKQLTGSPQNTYSYSVDFGESEIIALDLRSEKNVSKSVLLSDAHEAAVINTIRNCKKSLLYLAVPTTVSRMNQKLERTAYAISGILFELRKDRLKNPNRWAYTGFLGTIVNLVIGAPELADLRDDIDDSLISPASKETFLRMLNALLDWQEATGGKAFILGGDIHSSGVTEIIRSRKGKVSSVLQIVSSPISNEAMSDKVLGPTTYIGEHCLDERDGTKISARNISYFDGRNYAILPAGLHEFYCRFVSTVFSEPLDMPMTFRQRTMNPDSDKSKLRDTDAEV